MMRVLPIFALALSLVGCTGDRIKESLSDRFSMQGGLRTAVRNANDSTNHICDRVVFDA